MSDYNIGPTESTGLPYCDTIFSEVGFEVESPAESAVIHSESGVSRIGRVDPE